MKKSININLQGSIFHIEEDAFLILKDYLEKITKYFSSYQDNQEIIADIEVRMAEKFLEKISLSYQVITEKDVNELTEKIGNITDFQNFEDAESTQKTVVTPLSLPKSPKKIFRNSEDKIFGGVASGVAVYLGLDVLLMRFLFILVTFLGGLGVILYFIFWIGLPEAKTISEKIEMKGQPVTLESIENTLKQVFKEGKNIEESRLIRFLMFPFRLMAQIFAFIAPILQKLLETIGKIAKIAFSLFIIIMPVFFVLTALFMTFITWGIIDETPYWHVYHIPLEVVKRSMDNLGLIAFVLLLLIIIPSIFMVIFGISLTIRKIEIKKIFLWAAFGIWFLTFSIAGFLILHEVLKEQQYNKFYATQQEILKIKADTMQIMDFKFEKHAGNVSFVPYQGNEIIITTKIHANGMSKADAKVNAKMTHYNITSEINEILFPRYFTFSPDAVYRNQYVEEIEIQIPNNQKFRIKGYGIKNPILEKLADPKRVWFFSKDKLALANENLEEVLKKEEQEEKEEQEQHKQHYKNE